MTYMKERYQDLYSDLQERPDASRFSALNRADLTREPVPHAMPWRRIGVIVAIGLLLVVVVVVVVVVMARH